MFVFTFLEHFLVDQKNLFQPFYPATLFHLCCLSIFSVCLLYNFPNDNNLVLFMRHSLTHSPYPAKTNILFSTDEHLRRSLSLYIYIYCP